MNHNPTKKEIGIRAVEAAAAIARQLGHTWAEYADRWAESMGINDFREFVIDKYYQDRGVTRERPDLFVGSLGCGIPAPTVEKLGGVWHIRHTTLTGRTQYTIWQYYGEVRCYVSVSRPQGVAIEVDLTPREYHLWVSTSITTRKRHWKAALKVVWPLQEFCPSAAGLIEELERGLANAPEDYTEDDI